MKYPVHYNGKIVGEFDEEKQHFLITDQEIKKKIEAKPLISCSSCSIGGYEEPFTFDFNIIVNKPIKQIETINKLLKKLSK